MTTVQLARGLRPAKNTPALMFSAFRSRTVPPHPRAVDHLARLRDWRMLGNDRYGVCMPVTWANSRRLTTAVLTDTEVYPSLGQVFDLYRTQNPDFDPDGDPEVTGPGSPADAGMEMQTCLEHLHRFGGPDGVRAVAFARVNLENLNEVDAALSIFGGLFLGITVTDTAEQQFVEGRPWTRSPNAHPLGGHAVLAGGYTPDVRIVTWAQEAALTQTFWYGSAGGYRLVNQAWLVVWPEHLGTRAFQSGVDLSALRADYRALTGRTLALP